MESLKSWFNLWSGNGEAELKRFRKEVQKSIRLNIIDHKPFFPAGEINRLVTIERISTVLSRHASDDLVVFVSQHARKMFLALVFGEANSANDLACILKSCQDHGMSDDKLPVQGMACTGRGVDSRQCSFGHDSWLNVLHDSRWETIMYRFRTDQCTINAPVFTNKQFVYKLPAECVLPFVSKGPSERDGHFSTVSEFILHQDHYITCEEGGTEFVASREPIRVALKKMKLLDNEPGYNVASAWAHEVSALEEIRGINHDHLIRPLAAIKHGFEHYIMFEWADGGSLRDVWSLKDDDDKFLSAEHVMCVLEELLGLASALALLHKTNTNTKTGLATRARSLQTLAAPSSDTRQDEAPRSMMLQVPVPRIRIQGDSSDDDSHVGSDIDRSYVSEDTDMDGEVHWRHGDLKPDNILRFRDSSDHRRLGRLKIADLGLAKQHFLQTSRRHDQTQQRYTTSQYEAPEAMANLRLPRSRRYDIWSMGCIILEFVIVLLYGPDGLDAFYRERNPSKASTDTLYFTLDVSKDTAHVSGIVKHWISGILKDPECSRKEGSAIADLIELVRDRLLVVSLPDEDMAESKKKKCRADAAELKERLGAIRRLGMDAQERGDTYLLAEPTRAYSPTPPPLGARLELPRRELV